VGVYEPYIYMPILKYIASCKGETRFLESKLSETPVGHFLNYASSAMKTLDTVHFRPRRIQIERRCSYS